MTRFEELADHLHSLEPDFFRFYVQGSAEAGVRLRKQLIVLGKRVKNIHREILAIRKQAVLIRQSESESEPLSKRPLRQHKGASPVEDTPSAPKRKFPDGFPRYKSSSKRPPSVPSPDEGK